MQKLILLLACIAFAVAIPDGYYLRVRREEVKDNKDETSNSPSSNDETDLALRHYRPAYGSYGYGGGYRPGYTSYTTSQIHQTVLPAGGGYSGGYGAPGYASPGIAGAGYGVPGYGAPGYASPGIAGAGYGAPGYGASGYGAPAYGNYGYGAPSYGNYGGYGGYNSGYGSVPVVNFQSVGPNGRPAVSYESPNFGFYLRDKNAASGAAAKPDVAAAAPVAETETKGESVSFGSR